MSSLTIEEWTEKIKKLVDSKFPGVKRDFEQLPKLCSYLHSEVTELFEAWRDNDAGKVGEEYADIFIRLLDYARGCGINLDREVERKMAFNWTRPERHGRENV